jgi:hypothetical protein
VIGVGLVLAVLVLLGRVRAPRCERAGTSADLPLASIALVGVVELLTTSASKLPKEG